MPAPKAAVTRAVQVRDDTPFKLERAPPALKATSALDDSDVQAQLWVMECTMREYQHLQAEVASAKQEVASLSGALSSGDASSEPAWLSASERLRALVLRRDAVRPVISEMARRIDSLVLQLDAPRPVVPPPGP